MSIELVCTHAQVRVEVLLDLALSAGRSVLMVGPHGCGKTTVCRHFLQGRGQHMADMST